jgi:hypothetical protein
MKHRPRVSGRADSGHRPDSSTTLDRIQLAGNQAMLATINTMVLAAGSIGYRIGDVRGVRSFPSGH